MFSSCDTNSISIIYAAMDQIHLNKKRKNEQVLNKSEVKTIKVAMWSVS